MDVSARSKDTFGGGYHERIAHSKTTHDHALRRGTYRSKRRRSGSGQGGASTITQQLVKRRIVGDEVSLKRKIREAILAVEVTNTYSKQQILELYFNQIYYGNQAYGVKAAAQTYFGKSDLSKLTLAEAALLAGLPQAPSVLDTTQADNVDRAAERRA